MTAAKTLVPELRFPEFRENWEIKTFGDLFKQRQEQANENLPLLSLTAEHGIIPQNESGRKDNSNADKSRYLKVSKGDIAYNTMRMWEGRSALSSLEGLVIDAVLVLGSTKFFNAVVSAIEKADNTEERRLAYVAMTRARHTLVVGLPASHFDKHADKWTAWGFGILQ